MSSASVATNSSLAAAGYPTDLIESKFNELAKRILDELKQTTPRSEFFQAIDQILNEPDVRRHDLQAHRKVLLQKRRAAAQQQRQASKDASQKIEVTTVTSTTSNLDTEALKLKCDSLAERQRQQQEQLDSHQQILFDSQYRSLPSEITQAVAGHEQRRAQHRAAQAAGAALQKSSTTQVLKTQKSLDYETSSARVSKLTRDSGANDQQSSSSPIKQQKLSTKTSSTSPGLKTKGVVSSASSSSINNSASRQRSAIPQSTILSGIASAAYPLAKSATTTAAITTATSTTAGTINNAEPQVKSQPFDSTGGLVRQASLKINKQTREAQQEFIKRHTMGASLTASDKLRQRRPTKATISGNTPTSDDSDLDDDDDDDDDDDYEYQNLASRRAYLNQRFIDQSQQEQQQVQKMQQQPNHEVVKTSSEATNKTASRQMPNQQQQQQQQLINSASQVAKQRQRFSQGGAPIVRSSTIAGGAAGAGPTGDRSGQQQRLAVVSTSRPTSRNRNSHEDQHEEPRSLGGLLTSHDIGQLYKPHMNYSTSLLGNHRLSDDDEIIIIPTAQSPSLMSASVSPDPRHHNSYHQRHDEQQQQQQQPDQSTNNMDEFSERFSISRTKSFWERLANSKMSPTGSGGSEQQQQYNSSVRSLTSSGHGGGGGGGPNLIAVDTKSSQGSLLMNDLKQSPTGTGGDQQHSPARYPAAMKSAFDRMDSTGGSGNSHYSGCSSTSSASDADDGQVNGAAPSAGYGRLQAKRSVAAGVGRPRAAAVGQSPAIGQLIQQDELNRSDRFRQTR